MKPRLLDLFCGAGGAGMGYSRQVTDPLPPVTWPDFSQKDIDDLGLELCWRIYCRLQGWPEPPRPRSLLQRIMSSLRRGEAR